MIAGKFVMRQKKMPGIEMENIYQKSRDAAAQLWERLRIMQKPHRTNTE
jgi:hypothetical protein